MGNWEKDDSDETTDNFKTTAVLRLHIRYLRRWQQDAEKRIRSLEDDMIAAHASRKAIIKWITISSSCFAAVIELALHLFLKL